MDQAASDTNAEEPKWTSLRAAQGDSAQILLSKLRRLQVIGRAYQQRLAQPTSSLPPLPAAAALAGAPVPLALPLDSIGVAQLQQHQHPHHHQPSDSTGPHAQYARAHKGPSPGFAAAEPDPYDSPGHDLTVHVMLRPAAEGDSKRQPGGRCDPGVAAANAGPPLGGALGALRPFRDGATSPGGRAAQEVIAGRGSGAPRAVGGHGEGGLQLQADLAGPTHIGNTETGPFPGSEGDEWTGMGEPRVGSEAQAFKANCRQPGLQEQLQHHRLRNEQQRTPMLLVAHSQSHASLARRPLRVPQQQEEQHQQHWLGRAVAEGEERAAPALAYAPMHMRREEQCLPSRGESPARSDSRVAATPGQEASPAGHNRHADTASRRGEPSAVELEADAAADAHGDDDVVYVGCTPAPPDPGGRADATGCTPGLHQCPSQPSRNAKQRSILQFLPAKQSPAGSGPGPAAGGKLRPGEAAATGPGTLTLPPRQRSGSLFALGRGVGNGGSGAAAAAASGSQVDRVPTLEGEGHGNGSQGGLVIAAHGLDAVNGTAAREQTAAAAAVCGKREDPDTDTGLADEPEIGPLGARGPVRLLRRARSGARAGGLSRIGSRGALAAGAPGLPDGGEGRTEPAQGRHMVQPESVGAEEGAAAGPSAADPAGAGSLSFRVAPVHVPNPAGAAASVPRHEAQQGREQGTEQQEACLGQNHDRIEDSLPAAEAGDAGVAATRDAGADPGPSHGAPASQRPRPPTLGSFSGSEVDVVPATPLSAAGTSDAAAQAQGQAASVGRGARWAQASHADGGMAPPGWPPAAPLQPNAATATPAAASVLGVLGAGWANGATAHHGAGPNNGLAAAAAVGCGKAGSPVTPGAGLHGTLAVACGCPRVVHHGRLGPRGAHDGTGCGGGGGAGHDELLHPGRVLQVHVATHGHGDGGGGAGGDARSYEPPVRYIGCLVESGAEDTGGADVAENGGNAAALSASAAARGKAAAHTPLPPGPRRRVTWSTWALPREGPPALHSALPLVAPHSEWATPPPLRPGHGNASGCTRAHASGTADGLGQAVRMLVAPNGSPALLLTAALDAPGIAAAEAGPALDGGVKGQGKPDAAAPRTLTTGRRTVGAAAASAAAPAVAAGADSTAGAIKLLSFRDGSWVLARTLMQSASASPGGSSPALYCLACTPCTLAASRGPPGPPPSEPPVPPRASDGSHAASPSGAPSHPPQLDRTAAKAQAWCWQVAAAGEAGQGCMWRLSPSLDSVMHQELLPQARYRQLALNDVVELTHLSHRPRLLLGASSDGCVVLWDVGRLRPGGATAANGSEDAGWAVTPAAALLSVARPAGCVLRCLQPLATATARQGSCSDGEDDGDGDAEAVARDGSGRFTALTRDEPVAFLAQVSCSRPEVLAVGAGGASFCEGSGPGLHPRSEGGGSRVVPVLMRQGGVDLGQVMPVQGVASMGTSGGLGVLGTCGGQVLAWDCMQGALLAGWQMPETPGAVAMGGRMVAAAAGQAVLVAQVPRLDS